MKQNSKSIVEPVVECKWGKFYIKEASEWVEGKIRNACWFEKQFGMDVSGGILSLIEVNRGKNYTTVYMDVIIINMR